MCMKNQQIQQLFIQFINYVWYFLHVSALHCHLQGGFLVPSERCSIEEQSIEYSIDCSSIEHLSEGTRNAPRGWQCNTKICRSLLTPWSIVLLEKLTSFAASQEIPRIFMEPESSLPYSQVPATRPYPKPTPSSPHDSLQLPEDPS